MSNAAIRESVSPFFVSTNGRNMNMNDRTNARRNRLVAATYAAGQCDAARLALLLDIELIEAERLAAYDAACERDDTASMRRMLANAERRERRTRH
jgi:hypothetical protein